MDENCFNEYKSYEIVEVQGGEERENKSVEGSSISCMMGNMETAQ